MSQTITKSENVTKADIAGWGNVFRTWIWPTAAVIVIATGGYMTIHSTLSQVVVSTGVHDAKIEQLRKDHQDHENKLIELRANANAMNQRLDVLVASLEKRFDSVDKRLDNLSATMQALIMALNERGNK